MDATTAPGSEAAAAAANETDVETRIRQVELALIAREERVRRRIDDVGEHVRALAQPKRWIVPVAGVALAIVGLWWFARHRHAASWHAQHAVAARPPRKERLWLRLLTLALPLLPAAWRERLSPAGALKWGLQLLNRAPAGTAAGPPPQAVDHVVPARLDGDWYEIARMPAPHERGGPPLLQLQLVGERFEVLQRYVREDGSTRDVRGVARIVPASHGAKLEHTVWPKALQWLPIAWSDRWFLFVDAGYGVALVGSPRRDFLAILSRTPNLAASELQLLVERARRDGYAVERLRVLATTLPPPP